MNNKSNDKLISNLILKKSTSYLRISIITFLMSLILVSTCCILFINQYLQVKSDFLENNNTHIITITSSNSPNNKNELDKLYFNSKNELEHMLEKNFINSKFSIFNEYQLNIGLEDTLGDTKYIYSVDNDGSIVFDDTLTDDTLYGIGTSNENKPINLVIPKIISNSNGLTSNESYVCEMNSIDNIKGNNALNFSDNTLNKNYVSFNTYRKIIENMFDTTWDDFSSNYDKDFSYGINSIYKIHIYVDEISQVKKIASFITNNGYNTTYMLNAFDNFDMSLKNTFNIAIIFILIIFSMTATNLILSIKSYLKIQQKDMGILKQFGYSNKRIYKIFKKNLSKMFNILAFIILIYSNIIGLIFIDIQNYKYILGLTVILVLTVFGINKLIVITILRNYINKDILKLIKYNKEFE